VTHDGNLVVERNEGLELGLVEHLEALEDELGRAVALLVDTPPATVKGGAAATGILELARANAELV
jgi:hypothetical protein